MVQQKCKKANNKNMVLNLSILQEKEEKVKSISQRNRRIQSISESEAENLEGEISDALAEVEKTEKGSKSVMLYTTIVFSIALAVRQVLFFRLKFMLFHYLIQKLLNSCANMKNFSVQIHNLKTSS